MVSQDFAYNNGMDTSQLSLLEPAENMVAYEYSVLVTSLDSEVTSLVQHYRDRADCENSFDEIKTQWGLGRLCHPDNKTLPTYCPHHRAGLQLVVTVRQAGRAGQHFEAIVSRPLLLHGIGKQTRHASQKTLTITSTHGRAAYLRAAYERVCAFFDDLKAIAPQLTPLQCWCRILSEAMKKYLRGALLKPPDVIAC